MADQEKNQDNIENRYLQPAFYYTILEEDFKLKIISSLNLQQEFIPHVPAEFTQKKVTHPYFDKNIEKVDGGWERSTKIIPVKHLRENLMYPALESMYCLPTKVKLLMAELDIKNNISIQKETLDFLSRVLLLGIKYIRNKEKRSDMSSLMPKKLTLEEEDKTIDTYINDHKPELMNMFPKVFLHFKTYQVPLKNQETPPKVKENELIKEVFLYGMASWTAYNLGEKTALYMPN